MTKAVRIHGYGDTSVLSYEDVTIDAPADDEVQIRFKAVGLNFIDCYFRSGLYPVPAFPKTLGMEGAGIVEAIGSNVTEFSVGQRVCIGQFMGCYTELGNFPQEKVLPLPDAISFETAAGMMLKGMTAHYLIRQIYEVKAGDTILIHAAAGGVGSIATQWAKALGATVIGTVGSAEKAEQAKKLGCDYPILYKEENFTDRVREITDGEGVPVVYDSIGKETFMASLDCLKRRGIMVTYGNATGPVDPFSPALLAGKGSLMVTRPTLIDFISTREDLLKTATELFDVVANGTVSIPVNQTYALSDVRQAHEDLQNRKTTGSTVLIP